MPLATHAACDGFTLIELLVVVAIIALVTVFALPSISGYFQVSLNSATREIATTVKEAYNSTVLTGRVYRLVYDLKENSYWAESGPTTVLLDTAETKEKEERRQQHMLPSEQGKQASPFSMDKTITRKKTALPRGVVFEDVLTQASKDPLTEGLAYTHFFPHGMTEQTIIHLKDQQNHHISLVIAPLIGRTELYGRYVRGDEIFGK